MPPINLSDTYDDYYVYFHVNPITDEVFYVGKGRNKRYIKTYGRNSYWKNYINKYGFRAEIIESNLSEEKAFEREIFWINELKGKGIILTNLTDGGDGCSWWKNKKRPDISEKFKGHKVSEEAKKKMSISKKGKRFSIKTEFKKGQPSKNKGISKYEHFIHGRPAKFQKCSFCLIDFLARIDEKNRKFCSRQCCAKSKIIK